jgi:hypothetical protein
MSDILFVPDGSPRAKCPLCGTDVHLVNRPDDTRWRYIKHAEPDGQRCHGSLELVLAKPTPLVSDKCEMCNGIGKRVAGIYMVRCDGCYGTGVLTRSAPPQTDDVEVVDEWRQMVEKLPDDVDYCTTVNCNIQHAILRRIERLRVQQLSKDIVNDFWGKLKDVAHLIMVTSKTIEAWEAMVAARLTQFLNAALAAQQWAEGKDAEIAKLREQRDDARRSYTLASESRDEQESVAARLHGENIELGSICERLREQVTELERDKAVFDEFVRLNPTSLVAQIRDLRSQLVAAQKAAEISGNCT